MKETLEKIIEEVADLWSTDTSNVHPADSYIAKISFIEGAKCQAQRMYSEEYMIDFSEWVSLNFRNQHNYLRNLQKSRQGLDVPVDNLRGYFSTKELFELYKRQDVGQVVQVEESNQEIWECYEINAAQARLYGCKSQCKECKAEQLKKQ